MDRRTPSVSDTVRRAVEICDPDDVDQTLGDLEEQFEDDDEPITAVENIDERLAIALEGTDYEGENPAVAVAAAVVRYLSEHPGEVDSGANAENTIKNRLRAAEELRGRPADARIAETLVALRLARVVADDRP